MNNKISVLREIGNTNDTYVDDFDVEDPLVEVTLQSIRGITCHALEDDTKVIDLCQGQVINRSPRIPNITATVAFSGSAMDMQVSSSFLCPKTGNLMVESNPATLLSQSHYPGATTFPLIAQWTDIRDEHLIKACVQPHLSIRVPMSDARVPKMPLSRMNRDSNVVKSTPKSPPRRPPSLDESDVSTQSSELELDSRPSREDVRSEIRGGTSVVWSASGAAMPEIIELHVSLKIDEYDAKNNETGDKDDAEASSDCWRETIFPIGTAFLVFFSNDEGCTVIDLPLKKNCGALFEASGRLTLDDNAFIRIRVDVMPQGTIDDGDFTPFVDFFSRDMIDASSKVRADHDRRVLEPILEHLQKAEKMIHRPRKSSKRRTRKADRGEPSPREFRASRMMCDLGFFEIFSTLVAAVKCDDASGFLHHSRSMASTIDTAASLEI